MFALHRRFFFTAGCQQNLGHIIGIPLAQHKIEGPVTVMGIEIDTDHYYADKLCRLQLLVTSWTSSHKKGDAAPYRATQSCQADPSYASSLT